VVVVGEVGKHIFGKRTQHVQRNAAAEARGAKRLVYLTGKKGIMGGKEDCG